MTTDHADLIERLREDDRALERIAYRPFTEADLHTTNAVRWNLRKAADRLADMERVLRDILDEHFALGVHENGEVEYCQRPACAKAAALLSDRPAEPTVQEELATDRYDRELPPETDRLGPRQEGE